MQTEITSTIQAAGFEKAGTRRFKSEDGLVLTIKVDGIHTFINASRDGRLINSAIVSPIRDASIVEQTNRAITAIRNTDI